MTSELHYPGDHTADIVGRVMGPTTYGQLLTVIAADYDRALDRTTAHLRPATQPEVDAAQREITPPPAFGRATA